MSKIIGLLSIAMLAVLFLGVNITADRTLSGVRIDLTEGGLYTIQPATKRIARSPEEPLRFTLYYSKGLARGVPQLEAFGRRVTEMLDSIEHASNGKIILTVIDPEPFSQAEDDAVAEGLTPRPLNQTENLYFGLVATNSLDGREVIPFFRLEEERFLEYRIAQLITRLASPDKPTIGVLTTLPMAGGFDPRTQRPTPEWTVLRELGATFTVEDIDPAAPALPDGLDALMIVHPKGLSSSMLYSIDQYILRGGGAIIFVDPIAEAEPQQQQMGMPMGQDRSSNMPELFSAWGLSMDTTQLVGDLDLAISVRAPGPRQDIVPYIIWLNASEPQMASDDPVTGNLTRINLASVGSLVRRDDAPATLEPLISSTAQSGLVSVASVQGYPDPAGLLNNFFPDGESRTIAARVNGTVPTAFQDGPPAENDAPAEPHLTESSGPINVIVVADCDLLDDAGWVREIRLGGTLLGYDLLADNGAFAVNAAEQMAGSRDLLELRGRGTFSRPFTVLEEMRREADAEYTARLATLEEEREQVVARLNDLLRGQLDNGTASLVLTPEMRAEEASLRERQLEVRKELREVERTLRQDEEDLKTRWKLINTALVPVLLSIFALTLGGYRAARRRADRRKGIGR